MRQTPKRTTRCIPRTTAVSPSRSPNQVRKARARHAWRRGPRLGWRLASPPKCRVGTAATSPRPQTAPPQSVGWAERRRSTGCHRRPRSGSWTGSRPRGPPLRGRGAGPQRVQRSRHRASPLRGEPAEAHHAKTRMNPREIPSCTSKCTRTYRYHAPPDSGGDLHCMMTHAHGTIRISRRGVVFSVGTVPAINRSFSTSRICRRGCPAHHARSCAAPLPPPHPCWEGFEGHSIDVVGQETWLGWLGWVGRRGIKGAGGERGRITCLHRADLAVGM